MQSKTKWKKKEMSYVYLNYFIILLKDNKWKSNSTQHGIVYGLSSIQNCRKMQIFYILSQFRRNSKSLQTSITIYILSSHSSECHRSRKYNFFFNFCRRYLYIPICTLFSTYFPDPFWWLWYHFNFFELLILFKI